MAILGFLLVLVGVLGLGLVLILFLDLRKANRGEKSLFWEEDDDE